MFNTFQCATRASHTFALAFVFVCLLSLFHQADAQDIGSTEAIPMNAIPSTSDIVFHKIPGEDGKLPLGFGLAEIFVMDDDGGNVTQITNEGIANQGELYEHVVVNSDRTLFAANFREVGGDNLVSKLYVYDIANDTRRQLVPTFFSAGAGGIGWDDQDFIYFAAVKTLENIPGLGAELYKIKADGTQLQKLTNNKFGVADVGVGKSGNTVAYIGQFNDGTSGVTFHTVRIINTDGTNDRLVWDAGTVPADRVINGLWGAFDPVPSPDDTQVIFSVEHPQFRHSDLRPKHKQTHDLYKINVDGTGLTRLTEEGTVTNIVPDWKTGSVIYSELNFQDKVYGVTTINEDGTNKQRLGIGRFGFWLPPVP